MRVILKWVKRGHNFFRSGVFGVYYEFIDCNCNIPNLGPAIECNKF